MEDFLNYLCGKSGYMILRCQKVTKDELRERLVASIAKAAEGTEQQFQPDPTKLEQKMAEIVAKWIVYYGERGLDAKKVEPESIICFNIVKEIGEVIIA